MASEETPSTADDKAADSESQWTYGRLLLWTADFLKARGSQSAQLDGQVLLAHAAGCDRMKLFTSYHEVANEQTRSAFRSLVKQRADGAPVAYLVGSKEFYSLGFRVTSDVLVPRPETEHLVVALLDQIKAKGGGPFTIADVGTGSGCIAIAAAKHAPKCRYIAIDQSGAALAIARENAQSHGVDDRIEFLHGDLLTPLLPGVSLDFIVSNPPYVSEAEFAELAEDVRNYEPREALVSGATGTEVIERLLVQAAERLRLGGWLSIEISPMIHEQVSQLIASVDGLEQRATVKDLAGHARVVQAERV